MAVYKGEGEWDVGKSGPVHQGGTFTSVVSRGQVRAACGEGPRFSPEPCARPTHSQQLEKNPSGGGREGPPASSHSPAPTRSRPDTRESDRRSWERGLCTQPPFLTRVPF